MSTLKLIEAQYRTAIAEHQSQEFIEALRQRYFQCIKDLTHVN